ncbi:MAG: hypothetical protein ABI859_03220 [Pseudomonadota bacterium]
MSISLTGRGSFLATTLITGSLVSLVAFAAAPKKAPEPPVPTATLWEQTTEATAPYVSMRIIDTERMPLDPGRRAAQGWGNKTLFKDEAAKTGLKIMYVSPGTEGAYVHYHNFHEWAYNIAGDFTNNESTMPENVSGPLQRFREGNFLSRPPYSLHGGERGRFKHMMSQIGAQILIMEEGDVAAESFTVDPAVRNQPPQSSAGMKYNPNYKQITNWSTPRIIETIEKFPWQPVEGSPGLNTKLLIDDPLHGFRATMYFLEAGAKTPAFLRPHYFKEANQFKYVINGRLNIDTYASPTAKPVTTKLDTHYFFHKPPMAIQGVAADVASESGVVWLEVTYAKGTKWASTYSPIEDPTYLN